MYYSEFEYHVADTLSAAGFSTLHNIIDEDLSPDIKKIKIYNDLFMGDGTTMSPYGRFNWDAKENSWITRRSYEYFDGRFGYYILSAPGRDWHDINNIFVIPHHYIKSYFMKIPNNGWSKMPKSSDMGRQVKLLSGDKGEGRAFKNKRKLQYFLDSDCEPF